MGYELKKVLSNILTLSYPKYRFVTFSAILILLILLPFSLIEKTHSLSICYKLLGDKCYSVGITRGVASLLRGNFEKAVQYNPLSVIVLFIIVVFLINDFIKILKRK